MRNGPWANALVAALCLLSAGLASAQQTAQPTGEKTRDQNTVVVLGAKKEMSQWIRAESQHFVVYSDADNEDVNQLLDNLEKLDHLLRIYTRPVGKTELPEQKLTLYYHSRLSDLREIDADRPADAVGLYSSCTAGIEGFGAHIERIDPLGDAQLDKSRLNDSLSYVFEAYARHFLYRHTDIRSPASFIDGFAQYFSSVRFSDKQMVVGRIPNSIGEYLGFLDESRKDSLEYADVLEQNDAHARNYAGAAGVRLELEAKSWVLIHYMLSSADNRKRMNKYLDLAGRGLRPTTAFERAYGVKAADIDAAMWQYRRHGVEALRVEQPSLPNAHVRIRSLPMATGELVLADAALKACPTRQAGATLLKKVATLAARYPTDEFSRLTLSRAQIDWGNPQDALPALNAVLQADDAHFEARYLLGLANLRLAERSAGNAKRNYLKAAQNHLQRARSLNPQSAEAAFAVFKAEMAATDKPSTAALEGVISAWQSAREVDALTRYAALAYAYAGNGDEAIDTLDSLTLNERNKPMAKWATQWQSRLAAGVSRGDILAEMRREFAPNTPFKEWTIDKQSVMLAVSRNRGLETAAPFLKDTTGANAAPPPSDAHAGGKKP
jgi:tetratricopeptide (TPR) repeat protein